MFRSVKNVLVVSLISSALFIACSPNSVIEDNVVEVNTSEVLKSVSGNSASVKISSNLNPGYGQAVYFTGTFDEGNSWTTAVRGSYDNGWYLNVHSSGDFEWKALTGDYNLGQTVSISNSLTWESGENHHETVNQQRIYVLSRPGNARYGATCYFTGTFDNANNWQTAVKADWFNYNDYNYYAFVTSSNDSFEWKSLSGFGDYGKTYASPFNGLTWAAGDNLTQDNALTFEEYWATTSKVAFFDVYYDDKNEKLTFNGTGDIYGYNSTLQNKAETIVEIVNSDTEEVVYSGKYFDVKDSGISFSKMDYTCYTVKLIPVSIYGDLGTPYEVSFSPAMVLIGAWPFTMGCDTDSDPENQAHSVYMYKRYYIGRYEVTDAEFKDVFGKSSAYLAYKVYLEDNYPAISINFPFAIAYCNLRSIKEGLEPVYSVEGVDFANVDFNYVYNLPTAERAKWFNASVNWNANGYRLPTEAEWECAARDPQLDDELYSGSSNIEEVANTMAKNQYRPMAVGSLKANARGIYDMSGNAEEWVWDFYAPYSTDYQTDPVCEEGECHIVRGGGFSCSGYEYFTVYSRVKMTSYSSSTGLRVVRNGPAY